MSEKEQISNFGIVLLITIAFLSGMMVVQARTDDGLVAEWHFDGEAKDSSGYGNDGTIYGATFVDGKFGKSLSFDGVDDYVEVPDSPQLSGSGKDLTVDAWIKQDRLSDGSIIGKIKDTS